MKLRTMSQLHDEQVLDGKAICIAMVEQHHSQARELGLCTWTSDIVYSSPPVPSRYAYSANSGIWMILRLDKQDWLQIRCHGPVSANLQPIADATAIVQWVASTCDL